MAHRGFSARYPENTRISFDNALKLPVDAMEFDLQLTRDDRPVIFHDRSTSKLGRRGRTISDYSLRELRSFDAGSWYDSRFRNERVMTLEQAVARYGDRTRLMVEVKARRESENRIRLEQLTTITVSALRSARVINATCLLSFSLHLLTYARSLSSGLRTIWNMERPPGPGARRDPRMRGLFGLCVDVRNVSRTFVRRWHDIGKPVFVYTCNSDAFLDRALLADVDGIFSDRPDWLLERLARRFPKG